MKLGTITAVLSLMGVATVIARPKQAENCNPGDNCKLPDCRCWDDPTSPGGFKTREIPQIIIVSFDYALNRGNVKMYTDLLEGINNGNGCPIRGSFFVTDENTDFNLADDLYVKGHELGVNTIGSKIPSNVEEWVGNYSEVISKLGQAGVPKEKIIGASGPEQYFGGNDQLSGISGNELQYDTTCGTVKFDSGNFLWPYTYDFIENTPKCTVGQEVKKPFPGIWQFMVADLEYEGHKCAVPSACIPYITNSTQANDLFYNSFSQHYNQKTRPPYLMVIDPLWLTDKERADGTRQFLQLVSGAFEDTWIVTTQQALAWIKNPVRANETASFEPWSC